MTPPRRTQRKLWIWTYPHTPQPLPDPLLPPCLCHVVSSLILALSSCCGHPGSIQTDSPTSGLLYYSGISPFQAAPSRSLEGPCPWKLMLPTRSPLHPSDTGPSIPGYSLSILARGTAPSLLAFRFHTYLYLLCSPVDLRGHPPKPLTPVQSRLGPCPIH